MTSTEQPPPPARLLKVAAAQYPLDELTSFAAWEEKLHAWVRDGAATGADLLVFPEYGSFEIAATFGKQVAGDLQFSLAKVAETAGQRVATHQKLAAEFNVFILAGSGPVALSDSHYVNAAQLVAPDGQIAEQHKLMMTPFERNWGINPGTSLSIIRTAIGNFAVTICYDVEFPLLARAAALNDVDCLLVPSCTERVSGFHRVRTGALARALENTVAAVQSPTVGDAEWSPAVDFNTGAGGVYVPAEHGVSEDGVIAQGHINQPGWVSATVDLGRLRRIRETGEMRNFADWSLQPGGENSTVSTTVIDMTETASTKAQL